MNKISLRNRNKGTSRKPNWEYRFEGAKIKGKRHQISKSGYSTKKEALEAGLKHLNDYKTKNDSIIETNISYADFLDLWLSNIEKTASYNTYRNAETHVRNHIKPVLGALKLQSLKTINIQNFLNALAEEGYSFGTCNTVKSIINSSCKYAIEVYNYLALNPCTNAKIPHTKEERKRSVLSPEQFKQLCEATGLHLLFGLGYYMGLRFSEATALTWDDVDFHARTITVNKQALYQKQSGTYEWYFAPPKTKASARTIVIPDTFLDVLLRERESQLEREIASPNMIVYQLDKGIIKRAKKPLENRLHFLCIREDGLWLNKANYYKINAQINRDLFPFDYHTLRHTHATMLLEAGASIKAIQSRLGHSSIQTSMNIYAHSTRSLDEQAVASLDAFLKK